MTAQSSNTPADSYQASRPMDITVLMGGPSSERDISLISGEAVASALEQVGHAVTRSDISPSDTSALDRDGLDVVFIALHGDFGESGEVQTLCEQRGLPYIGSGPRASRLAMDKAAAKQIFKRSGLTTPDWMIVESYHSRQLVEQWLEEIPPPVVVKPVDGGSSVDIIIAQDAPAREEAMEALLEQYGRVMLERLVVGREMTVGILGEEALPVLEIVPGHAFYDKAAKYDDDAGTQYLFDHGLPQAVVDQLQADSLQAHAVLDCRDLSRVDFILDGENVPQILEINTIPGFTSHSLLPMAAANVGIGFGELVDRLAMMAQERSAVV
jgi:D-alanine-D-alanine ligase